MNNRVAEQCSVKRVKAYNIMRKHLAIALALVLASLAGAQGKRAVAPAIASANAIRAVDEIHWHTSPPEMTDIARKEGKLIFYVHMLGSLSGCT